MLPIRSGADRVRSRQRESAMTMPTTSTEASMFGSPTVPLIRFRSPAAVWLTATSAAFGVVTRP